jgi:periplasmic protein TonB
MNKFLILILSLCISYSVSAQTTIANKSNPEKPFTFVEQMPHFPEGENALMSYLSKNIKYPSKARKNQIEGTVVVSFTVNKDGSISDVKVRKGVGGGCSEESVRVVKAMPNWIP